MPDAQQVQQQPAALTAEPAVLKASISITRAATGKVEHYDLLFAPLPAGPETEKAE